MPEPWRMGGETEKSDTPEQRLFTPGPLSVSSRVRAAMNVDLGSRSPQFMTAIAEIRQELLKVGGLAEAEYTVIPVAGSGTTAVEAAFSTAIGKAHDQKALIISNGAYAERMGTICAQAGFRHSVLRFPETQKLSASALREWLSLHGDSISLIAFVHCETSTGVVNPAEEICAAIRDVSKATILVDAMSSFGGHELRARPTVLVTSANKCLQGVPGLGLVIARRDWLEECQGRCRSLSLDLCAQANALDASGQFRFTPPTHACLALREAISELRDEGGIEARASRYRANNQLLRSGMAALGFVELLDAEASADSNIISSFLYPTHPNWDFQHFYEGLASRGFLIYPGKVTKVDSFRVGNIGDLHEEDFQNLLSAIPHVLESMGIPTPICPVQQTKL